MPQPPNENLKPTVRFAAWVMNPGEEPVANQRLEIDGEGRLVSIRPIQGNERAQVESVVALPGFVNAHTHLEFSDRSKPFETNGGFTDWVGNVIRFRMQRSEAQVAEAVRAGLKESIAAGIRVIGEINTSNVAQAATDDFAQNVGGAEVVMFRESLGFHRDSIDKQLQTAKAFLQTSAPPDVIRALSPHAPYSLHSQTVEGLVQLAKEHHAPLAMHLAETRDEIELLEKRKGTFVTLLNDRSLWDDSALEGVNSIRWYLEQLATLPTALAVHCNYLTDDDIDFLSHNRQVSVVYCPRTHAAFGHAPHPWPKLEAAGVPVVLGTDSRASNPDLSILKELQFVAQKSGRAIHELLPMITTTPARALRLNESNFQIGIGNYVQLLPETELQ